MLAALLLAAAAPAQIDAALLGDLPVLEAKLTAHGMTVTCTGPALSAVLGKLGYPAGEKLGGPALAQGVVIRAKDGYAVLLSLGEIDATLGNTSAIIATQCDGKPLDDTVGPYRLILPGEARPARSARQVVRIESVTIETAPAASHH